MNIQVILEELKNKGGMTDQEIGIAIGAPQATVFRLRKGTHKTCSYERGKKIAELHAERCGSSMPSEAQP